MRSHLLGWQGFLMRQILAVMFACMSAYGMDVPDAWIAAEKFEDSIEMFFAEADDCDAELHASLALAQLYTDLVDELVWASSDHDKLIKVTRMDELGRNGSTIKTATNRLAHHILDEL